MLTGTIQLLSDISRGKPFTGKSPDNPHCGRIIELTPSKRLLRLLTGELKLHGPSEHHHTKTTTGTYAKLFNNVDFRIDLASFCILLSDSQSVFTT